MLVTGASGTVGSVVAKRLAERGARVRAAARTRPAAPRFIIDGARILGELGYAPVDRWDELLGALASHHAQATNSA